MNRTLGVAILAVVAFVLGGKFRVGPAQAQGFPPLTRHVREVTLNGEARLDGQAARFANDAFGDYFAFAQSG